MPNRNDIVAQLAKERIIEKMCVNVAKHKFDDNLEDLAQMTYEILLTYDEERVVKMYEDGQLSFFIARIIMNQYKSVRSPFYSQCLKFGNMSVSLFDSEFDSDIDIADD